MADEKKGSDSLENGFAEKPRAVSPAPPRPSANVANVANQPIFPILAYCGSSILMTVTNKYVLSGRDFNLNFFLLAVQVRSRAFPQIAATMR